MGLVRAEQLCTLSVHMYSCLYLTLRLRQQPGLGKVFVDNFRKSSNDRNYSAVVIELLQQQKMGHPNRHKWKFILEKLRLGLITLVKIYINHYCHKLPHPRKNGAWIHLIFHNQNPKLYTTFIQENEEDYLRKIYKVI